MSDRLSPQGEAVIRERAEAATPGPWSLIEDEGDTFRAPAWEVLHPSDEMVARVREWATADARFIAHAREDVPALLAEVERQRAELAAVRAERDEARAQLAEYEPLNPQQCPAGKHADWLVDSEFTHTCPWCQIDELERKSERDLDQVMKERDEYHEVADKLAYAVAPEEVIGEHSSMNDPWENAYELITPMAEVDKLREEAVSLREDSATLNALHAAGVDNWEGYDEAVRS